jgi:hypothetical protein
MTTMSALGTSDALEAEVIGCTWERQLITTLQGRVSCFLSKQI